ncbi:hypothetical protein KW464_20035 [Vibrio fluvialis]|nr:hypothetical protein [Vibrio fluvialis]
MSNTASLKGFSDDTWINGIGDLFRNKDGSRWGINLSVFPHREKGRDSTYISNAPILVRKTIINPTRDYFFNRYETAFEIETTGKWEIDRLGNCPALERRLSQELKQYCFVFSFGFGIKVYLPQFELARALFFHNGYLARSSMIHDVLNNEFSIERDEPEDWAEINVLEVSSLKKEFYDDYGFRRVLAWLLLDPQARRSFESIAGYQLRNGYDEGAFRKWRFRFDPPELRGMTMSVRGNFDPASKTLLVYEISGVRSIPGTMPGQIGFYSSKFISNEQGPGNAAGSVSAGAPGERVDDLVEESGENKPVMLKGPRIEFEFAQAFETRKMITRKRPSLRGTKSGDELRGGSGDVSTEESGPNGDLPCAEWDKLDEQTDDAHLYLDKFSSYFQMLDLLEAKHDCKVVKFPLRKLPAVGRCKKHILETDGNPRCLSVARVKAGFIDYYLLEVDTSDAKTALATKVITANTLDDIDEHILDIEKRLLKASLAWPKAFFDLLVGSDNHFGVSHQHSGKGGCIPLSDISRWAERMFQNLA